MKNQRDIPKKRGRPSSGVPRAEIEKLSSKARRIRLLAEGKEEIKAFVTHQTKIHLQQLKAHMGVGTTGEVIDVLIQQEVQKLNLVDTLNLNIYTDIG